MTCRARNKDKGFTLIEVLCVLVMIGLLSGVVVMNLPARKSPTLEQAESLTRHLNALSQDALISGEIRAFGLSETDYAFYNYDGEEFVALTTKAWDEDARIKFSRNGQAVKLPETILPVVIFEPTQLSTSFELKLSDRQGLYMLSSAGDGRVVLERDE